MNIGFSSLASQQGCRLIPIKSSNAKAYMQQDGAVAADDHDMLAVLCSFNMFEWRRVDCKALATLHSAMGRSCINLRVF